MDERRAELEALYRRCAVLRQRLQDAALRAVPLPKLREHAERLGLPVAEEMAQISDYELRFAFDLAIYTALPGRSRAIDRAVRQHRNAEGEAMLVLRALEGAWFSIFRVLGPHAEAGLLLEDTLLGGEVWVLDEALTESAAAGTVLATRLARVRGFAITCGVTATLDEPILMRCRRIASEAGVSAADLAADPRFALMIYQLAMGFQIGDELGAA